MIQMEEFVFFQGGSYEEKKLPSPYSSLLQDAIFKLILAEFLGISKYKEHEHALIRMVRNIMREHIEETLRLEDLARHVGMSKYHFLRKYKSLTGRTPMEDLRIVRVEIAKELILTSDLPLKAIASKVGFVNEYHFSRIFHKYLNVPPGYFKRQ